MGLFAPAVLVNIAADLTKKLAVEWPNYQSVLKAAKGTLGTIGLFAIAGILMWGSMTWKISQEMNVRKHCGIPSSGLNSAALSAAVKSLDDEWAKKMNGRIDKMIWIEGSSLHVVNPAGYFLSDGEKENKTYEFYERGLKINKVSSGNDCLFFMIKKNLDEVVIHTHRFDALGTFQKDDVQRIPASKY